MNTTHIHNAHSIPTTEQAPSLSPADIHIRDPFVLYEGGIYYMYGTRAEQFGIRTGGFDVYTSRDLSRWCGPYACFDSEAYGLNLGANWAPEVHAYRGAYYMLATFTRPCGLRATFLLRAEHPMGPFIPHSDGPLTPEEWECLDGTLYVNGAGAPYLVFCHEHTQIIDGTICLLPLTEDLRAAAGEPVTLFCASSPSYVTEPLKDGHYVTDGPFMLRSDGGRLFMLWSTFVGGKYAECLVTFPDGEPSGRLVHLPPILDSDGGHGMIFRGADGTYLTYHTPNTPDRERPCFRRVCVSDEGISFV